MATSNKQQDDAVAATAAAEEAPKPTASVRRAGEAMVRRHGIDPEAGDEEARESLRRVGIDADTYERKALTYQGAIREFGKPIGPRLYNEVHVAAFGPVRPGQNDINLMSLEDRWISPRRSDPSQRNFETEEEFDERKAKFTARRERVQQLIAAAEKEAAKGAK